MKEQFLPLLSKLAIGPMLGGQDLNVENPAWEEADLRVCLTFNGDIFTKSVSSTVIQLFNLVKQAEEITGKKIFVDFCYQPPVEDVELLRSKGLPDIFGWSSFHKLKEFDVLCASFSIHYEILHFYQVLLGGGVEPFHYKRIADSTEPFVIGGGNVGTQLEPLYGDRRGALLDVTYFGEGEERLPKIIASIVKYREGDHDVSPAEAAADKSGLIKVLVKEFDNVYYPNGWEHTYEGNQIKAVTKKFDWVPDKTKFYRCYSTNPPIFEKRLLITTPEDAASADLQISHGCGGCSCYFCSEGALAGNWRQFDKEHIKAGMKTLKRYAAPNTMSLFSYNTNFHSDAFELYERAGREFSKISVIALRADVLSETPEYLRLLKFLGAAQVSVALEGISTRIRENYLNKSLTWDQFKGAAKLAFAQRFGRFKLNVIQTGHETKEDVDEFIVHMKELEDYKKEHGYKTPIFASTTTLVHYMNTGLECTPRKSTVAEMYRGHIFNYFVEECKKIGVATKFNRGLIFVYQQMLVDCGRSLTELVLPWYEKAWKENKSIVNSKPTFRGMMEHALKGLALDTEEGFKSFFLRERSWDEVTPWSSYDVVTKQYRLLWKANAGKKEMHYCLRSTANRDTRCWGCNMCPSKEWKEKNIIHREVESKTTLEDIFKASFENKPQSALRVSYKLNDDPVSLTRFKTVHDHFIASRFIRASEFIEKEFYAVKNYADQHITADSQPEHWGGISFFDIVLKTPSHQLQDEPSLKDTTALLAAVNKMIGSSQVIAIYPVEYSHAYNHDLDFVWKFETKLPKLDLIERYSKFKGKVKIGDKTGMKASVSVTFDKSEFDFYAVQGEGHTIGFMNLPAENNPYLAMSSFLSYTVKSIRENFKLTRVAMLKPVPVPCKQCGLHYVGINVVNNKMQPYCSSCIAKGLALKAGK